MRLAALVVMALLALVAADSLGSDQGGTQFRNVTRASDHVYERLGASYYHVGVAFQAGAILCMFVLAVSQVYLKHDQGMKKSEVWDTPQITTLVLTTVAYVVLDGLYRPTFIGSELMIFSVSSTCTGMNCTAPYSVIASGAEAALAESCNQFAVHDFVCGNTSFYEQVMKMDNDFCKDDPASVGDVYFEGRSQWALNLAFVAGCFLAFLLNFADVLRFCKQDKVLKNLMSVLKIGELSESEAMDLMVHVEDVKPIRTKEEQEARKVMRFQTFMRMSMEGMSYGLMMMVLEVEIDGDCIAMRAMLPIRIAVLWSYVIISATSVIVVSFCFFALLISIRDRACSKLNLRPVSWCLVVLMSLFVLIAFLAYVYSIVLAFFLAYKVPSDSAVIVGAGLAVLSMVSQAAELWDPSPSAHWGESDHEDDDEDDAEDSDDLLVDMSFLEQ